MMAFLQKQLMLMPFLMLIAPALRHLSKFIFQIRYLKRFKRFINLKNPTLFWDKVIWMSLYSDTSQWSVLADKYAVRKYVEEKCGKGLLNELYGLYERPEDINYDDLPDSFVIKTTNGCANNILVKDKRLIDVHATQKLLNRWLEFPFGEITGESHYCRIKPRIIVEKFLRQESSSDASLIDYKFYSFGGVPKYVNVISDREFNTHEYRRMMYDLEWNAYPKVFIKGVPLKLVDRPLSLNRMIAYVKLLSEPFPFVRVDLYEINGVPIFGEMTFTPGTDMGFTTDFQKHLGSLIQLPKN
jgi:hypothetical protein